MDSESATFRKTVTSRRPNASLAQVISVHAPLSRAFSKICIFHCRHVNVEYDSKMPLVDAKLFEKRKPTRAHEASTALVEPRSRLRAQLQRMKAKRSIHDVIMTFLWKL